MNTLYKYQRWICDSGVRHIEMDCQMTICVSKKHIELIKQNCGIKHEAFLLKMFKIFDNHSAASSIHPLALFL